MQFILGLDFNFVLLYFNLLLKNVNIKCSDVEKHVHMLLIRCNTFCINILIINIYHFKTQIQSRCNY